MKITIQKRIIHLLGYILWLVVAGCSELASASHWEHVVDFDHNYRLLWTSNNVDITFEIQAKTLGYVGLGFSHDGTLADSDIAIGWIDQGHVHFQYHCVPREVVIHFISLPENTPAGVRLSVPSTLPSHSTTPCSMKRITAGLWCRRCATKLKDE